MMKNKKGFTLIELLVVMLIIGILILLARPKFLNYVEEAKETQIIHDIKVVENINVNNFIKNNKYLVDSEAPVDENYIKKMIKSQKAYIKEGMITENKTNELLELDFLILNKKSIKSASRTRLNGNFLIDKNGRVIYLNDMEEIPENEYMSYRYLAIGESYKFEMQDGEFVMVLIEEVQIDEIRYLKRGGDRIVPLDEIILNEEEDNVSILIEALYSKKLEYDNQTIEVRYIDFYSPDRDVHVDAPFILRLYGEDTGNKEIARQYRDAMRGTSVNMAGILELEDGRIYETPDKDYKITDDYFNFDSDRHVDRPIVYKDIICKRIK